MCFSIWLQVLDVKSLCLIWHQVYDGTTNMDDLEDYGNDINASVKMLFKI